MDEWIYVKLSLSPKRQGQATDNVNKRAAAWISAQRSWDPIERWYYRQGKTMGMGGV